LIFPELSETVAARETVNIWHCPICGNEFETTDKGVEKAPSDAELVQEFLPNLLVA
jgi:ribosomal protein L37AE/L43A